MKMPLPEVLLLALDIFIRVAGGILSFNLWAPCANEPKQLPPCPTTLATCTASWKLLRLLA